MFKLEELDIRQDGLSEKEIPIIEICFDVNIVLQTNGEDGQAAIYRNLCYIHDIDRCADVGSKCNSYSL